MAWLPWDGLGKDGVDYLKRDLRIVPKKYKVFDDAPTEPIDTFVEDRDHNRFGIPRRYFFDTASEKKGNSVVWRYSIGEPMNNIECLLRQEGKYAEQADAISAFEGWYKAHDRLAQEGFDAIAMGGSSEYISRCEIDAGKRLGGVLRGDTGFGKTNAALALFHRLGRAVVIVVHKEFLLRQWVRRISKFLPQAKIGIVQGDQCDFEGCDFVIAMTQSLALEGENGIRRYPAAFYEYPGVLAVDEVHRLGALTWSPVAALFPAKYRIGLTATPRRKDGAADVFWWSIGDILYDAKTVTPVPSVRVIETGIRAGDGILSDEGAIPSIVINIMTKMKRRNAMIADEAMKALRASNGRKLFIVSERLEQLQTLERLIREQAEAEGIEDFSTGFYVGEWFTGETTLSLKSTKDLTTEEYNEAIEIIYRHFRRQKANGKHVTRLDADDEAIRSRVGPKPRAPQLWKGNCGRRGEWMYQNEDSEDVHIESHEVQLYLHDYSPRVLEVLSGKQLIALARDYDIAQTKAKQKTKTVTEEELFEAEQARVIFATFQMCSEGVDIPAIDTEILASPVSDIEQTAGRIRRWCTPERFGGEMGPKDCQHYCAWRADRCQGKPDPILTDIVDVYIPMARKRKRYRLAFYNDIGARVAGDT